MKLNQERSDLMEAGKQWGILCGRLRDVGKLSKRFVFESLTYEIGRPPVIPYFDKSEYAKLRHLISNGNAKADSNLSGFPSSQRRRLQITAG